MSIRKTLTLVAALLGSGGLGTADEPLPEEYARVEVQGKLTGRKSAEDGPVQYAVTFSEERGGRVFFLKLRDDTLRKLAKELDGQFVVVTGDCGFVTVGDGKRKETKNVVPEISVKSLKKAERPKK